MDLNEVQERLRVVMNYREAIEYLYSVGLFGVKLGLANTEHLLEELGRPQDQFLTVHVAGTNGKGSVCALVSSILSVAGYRVGMFTSPHVLSFRERIRIGRKMISQEAVCHHLMKLLPIIETMPSTSGLAHPTFFEIVTALAADYFAENGADVAVVETGMGGRLDATNALPSRVEIITAIGLEHTEHLGTTLEQIAAEKAGIIKDEATVVVGEQDERSLKVILRKAIEKKAEVVRLGDDITFANREIQFPVQRLDIRSTKRTYSGIILPLLGEHQAANCCLAVAAVEELQRQGFTVALENIFQGIEETRWPGRFEVIQGRPNYILDAACNPHACQALVKTLSEVVKGSRLVLIAGFLREKDTLRMCEILFPVADDVLLTEPRNERALPVEELRRVAQSLQPEKPIRCFKSLKSAISCASTLSSQENCFVCVTGSNYLLGPAKKALGLDDLPDDFVVSEMLGKEREKADGRP